MQMMFSKNIGKHKYTFTVEGNNLFEMVMKSQQIGFQDVYRCGLCESEKLYLRAYVTEEDHYEYVKIHCAECGGTITFGKAKKDGAFFLRKRDDGKLDWVRRPEKSDGSVRSSDAGPAPARSEQAQSREPSKAERVEKAKQEGMSKEDDLPF